MLIGVTFMINWILILRNKVLLVKMSEESSLIFGLVFLTLGSLYFIFTPKEILGESEQNSQSYKKENKLVIKDVIKKILVKKEVESSDKLPIKKNIVQPKISFDEASKRLIKIQNKLDKVEELYKSKLRKNPNSQETSDAYKMYEQAFYEREELLNSLKGKEREDLKKFIK